MKRAHYARIATVTVMTLILTGCAMFSRPTLESVQAATVDAMQRIADQVPGGVVEVRTADTPYLACSDSGYNYVARWAVTPSPGFDGRSFVDQLPDQLGDEYAIAETVPISAPAVALDRKDGVVLDVKVLPFDGGEVVDIYGISPCGEGPLPTD